MAATTRRSLKWLVLTLVLMGGSFGGGIYAEKAVLNDAVPVKEQLQYVTGKQSNQPKEVDFGLFWEAWSVVDNHYFEKADKEKRLHGAITGMLYSTGDRYAAFLPKDENELFMDNLSGSFSGIGAELSLIDGYPTIVTPLAGSPAEKSGVKPKDIIVKIDGVDTADEDFAHAINRIRGEEGSTVTLTVAREGEADVLELPIVRAKIELPNVSYKALTGPNGLYGYIRLNEFLEDSPAKIVAAIEDLKKQQVTGYVIDLRNNPGGLLNVAVNIASLFVEPSTKPDLGSVIVSQKDRGGEVVTYKTSRKPLLVTEPLVVLINDGSASASEILAGALLDYGRAKLVGATSFGKGSVQELKNLKDGSSVKITVAHWLTPAGNEIDGVGIVPTTEVVLNQDEKVTIGEPGEDRQLREAANLLQ